MTVEKYELLDSGDSKRLERFGPYIIERPCSQAIWQRKKPGLWDYVDLRFSRERKSGWSSSKHVEDSWTLTHQDLLFKIQKTNFGHLGLFPEHLEVLQEFSKQVDRQSKVLNLFAYTGAASILFAKQGAFVTHLDASKTSIQWAKENAKINGLEKDAIRWILDDAIKFLRREVRRGTQYDAIILDPPSFGRGASSQLFVIEKDIHILLSLCRKLLTKESEFVFFSCHTPGFTRQTMSYLLQEYFGDMEGEINSGEMLITSDKSLDLPSGSYGFWRKSL